MVRTLDSHSKAVLWVLGKPFLGSHGPSSILWSEDGPCCETIAYFVGGKRGGFDLIKDVSKSTNLRDFVCHGIYYEICPEIRPKICYATKILKNHGLPKFASGPPLGGRPDINSSKPQNFIHSLPCRTPCRLFHPWGFLWAFRPSPSCVKWTWTVSALSTNESSYIAMVMGLQSCVWSGPK